MQIQSTKDIIKALPFEVDFKQQLLSEYDGLDENTKDAMMEILWEAYDDFFDLKLVENIEEGIVKGSKDEEELDATYYNRMVDKTEKFIEEKNLKNLESVDLSSARNALSELLDQAKKPKIN